ncbi:Hypothetical protein NCS54_01513500 [Fusarium falciforme]|uniref:Hypothetical protein n=1 Tax=Fusarium falciforme TaxID=195108 RepID=UPI0023019B08|nr:Hypothetical protein NCS54_01513500 [Fusarium falciforme]WAO97405.1 Hypothetical protein NCS54_01513500 [Fusarium falciforme]
MALKRKPTFLLLSESRIFPAEMGPRMLGAFCAQMDDPVACWKPNDVSKVLSVKFPEADTPHQPLQVVMGSAQHILDQMKSVSTKAVLEGVLKVAWENGYPGTTFQLESQQIRTVRLPQQGDIFKVIVEDDEVKQFRLEKDDDPYFMITGYKSCLNAIVEQTSGQKPGFEVDVTVPTEQVLTAAGVAVPPGVLPRIGASASWNTSWAALSRYTLQGEYIYAVEYREILKRSWISRILNRRKTERDKRKVFAASSLAQPSDRATFGGGREDDDSDGTESDSEDELLDVAEYLERSWTMEEGDDPSILGMEVNEDGEPSRHFV